MTGKNLQLIRIIGVLFLIRPSVGSTRIIHVPEELSTIQRGINEANVGDTVIVSEGTYYELIDFMGKSILVASTYLFDSQINSVFQTIIDGDSTITGGGSVVSFQNNEDNNATLLGFTITNGIGTHRVDGIHEGFVGGGVYGVDASPRIIHNIIRGNTADARPVDGDIACGGGIYFEGGSPYVVENLIINNAAYWYRYPLLYGEGGGIYFINCLYATIERNNVVYNESGADAAGITAIDSWVTISYNEISYNEIRSGIMCTGRELLYLPAFIQGNIIIANELYGISAPQFCYLEIRNNLIASNLQGAGIGASGFSVLDVCSNTIVQNGFGNDLIGGGISLSDNQVDIRNNIIAENNGYGLKTYEPDDNSYVDYNNIWGNTIGQYYRIEPGARDISCNPLFKDSGIGDYTLSALSPCIDAGDPQSEVSPGGGDRIDIGAYEFPQLYNGALSYLSHSGEIEQGEPYTLGFHLASPLEEPIVIDAWLEFSGPMCGIARKFLDVTIPPGDTMGTLNVVIPGWLTPGYYTVKGRLGIFGEQIWDSEVFDLLVKPAPKKSKTVW